MGLFDNILKDEESLFTNEMALDFDYIPDIIPFRENEQNYIATCIKPLFQERSGKNLIITGTPGIGKTAAIKFIFQELKKETENIIPIYINCYKKDTPHKIALEICDQLNYKFTQNKTTEDLIKEITKILNKKAAVICLDEIDKLDDTAILYTILEDVYKKTILLITNYKEWLSKLDQRIKSRLTPERLEFKPYNYEETAGILKQRIKFAFVPDIFKEDALNIITEKTLETQDIRTGLYLLKESGNIAESKAKREITLEHAQKAIEKIKETNIVLTDEEKEILTLIKLNIGKTRKEIYELFPKKGLVSYKTFSRRVAILEENNLITKTDKYEGGRSSVIKLK